jgi:hypothetical protein
MKTTRKAVELIGEKLLNGVIRYINEDTIRDYAEMV